LTVSATRNVLTLVLRRPRIRVPWPRLTNLSVFGGLQQIVVLVRVSTLSLNVNLQSLPHSATFETLERLFVDKTLDDRLIKRMDDQRWEIA